jgi:hypothetical protein
MTRKASMSQKEALHKALDGHKVRLESWDTDQWVGFDNDQGCFYDENDCGFPYDSIHEGNWEIYQERLDWSQALAIMEKGGKVQLADSHAGSLEYYVLSLPMESEAGRIMMVKDGKKLDRECTFAINFLYATYVECEL